MYNSTRPELTVVKVGGAIVEQPESLDRLINDFAALPGCKILVHGGGRSATALATRLGIQTTMIDGRRVTDNEMLEVVTMVYGGLVNKRVVARLQALGVNALGVTGADMNLILSERRAPRDGVDYGYVGDVRRVDTEGFARLLRAGVVPVVAPLTHDGKCSMLNTNADTMAGEVASALTADFDVRLVFCFEKAGVLLDADDDSTVIKHIDRAAYKELRDQNRVAGGMLPKLDNSFKAIDAGVNEVVITCASSLNDLTAGSHLTR
ncbi:MAG: acetylglutamate kinase [Muribaculaceae bacterium]|nr:acetylglutamate kinase [Muribaculaceae bacterium]